MGLPAELVVDPGGRRGFATIAEALAAADALPPGPLALRISRGTYREKLRLTRPDLALIGAGPLSTRIVHDDHARRLLPGGEAMGTFASYTVYAGAMGISMRGLTIENDSGWGEEIGQAVALYADADRLRFEDCAFLGRQDTICTGPLPKDPPPAGIHLTHQVAGLADDEPSLPFRQIYRACLVSGDVDFVFGSAAALFEDCEIRTLGRGGSELFVCAPSTYPGQAAGFVFHRCRLSCEPGDPGRGEDRVFLGRPWRECGRAVFARCELGAHIAPSGWDDWGKSGAHERSYLGEYCSTGPGARGGARAAWSRRPGGEEVEAMIGEIEFD